MANMFTNGKYENNKMPKAEHDDFNPRPRKIFVNLWGGGGGGEVGTPQVNLRATIITKARHWPSTTLTTAKEAGKECVGRGQLIQSWTLGTDRSEQRTRDGWGRSR